MLLIVRPNQSMAITAATSDNGSASSVMTAARMFIRNTTTTRMTRAAPSMNAVRRLSSDCSMKSACLNRSRWICMP